MTTPVLYDITRLVTRLLNRTPNGIDRIDHAFATACLATPDSAGLITTPAFSSIVDRDAAAAAVEGIAAHWGETTQATSDPVLDAVRARLAGQPGRGPVRSVAPGTRSPEGRVVGTAKWIRKHGLQVSRRPLRHAPRDSCYLNVSQFPLWIDGCFSWLGGRPDVKGVFFIHDLLPLETPEYFRPAEYERHLRRLRTLARYGAGAIVTTQVVADALRRHLAGLGRTDFPILVAPTPAAPIFHHRSPERHGDAAPGYFVMCGTIEPRKNHAFILQVWREMVLRHGPDAPRLILVGARGWENENAVDLLERSPALQDHVIEVSGLTTPGFKQLLDGSRALLMPSFAEGYGLPLVEALTAGVPVIASGIPPFMEVGAEAIVSLSPLDGPGWTNAILSFAGENSPERAAAIRRAEAWSGPESQTYHARISAFLSSLVAR